jgi:hypothetical protein
MDRSTAGNSESLNLAVTIVTGFLALGIRDYTKLFNDGSTFLNERTLRSIQLWEGVLAWEQNQSFGE